MIRILLFILAVIGAAAGLAWFADRPGSVTVRWLGYQIETTAFVGALAVLAAVVLLVLLFGLVRYLLRRPAAVKAYLRERRRRQGFDALSRGLLAIGVGDRGIALGLRASL
jgi:HemY protein